MPDADRRAQLDRLLDRLRERGQGVIQPALCDASAPLAPIDAALCAREQLMEISHAAYLLREVRSTDRRCIDAPDSVATARSKGLLLSTYEMAFSDLRVEIGDHDRMLVGWFLLSCAHGWPIAGSPFDNVARSGMLLRIAHRLWHALQARSPQEAEDLSAHHG